jgi:hypothetical protein
MVQVSDTTYRIVETSQFYQVVRLLDDRVVGAFRYETGLELTHAGIPVETLLGIAREARRSARLSWSPPRKQHSFWFTSFVRKLTTCWNRMVSTIRNGVPDWRRLEPPFMLPCPVRVTTPHHSKRP